MTVVRDDRHASAGDGAAAEEEALPLLSSGQMAEFVSRGLLRFDGLVPEEINRLAVAELSGAGEADGRSVPPFHRERYRPGSRLADCFAGSPGIGAMLALPQVRGLIQSLVGADPRYDHHAVHVRRPGERSQHLHGDAIIDTRAAFDIQLMYYPERTTPEGGGTMLVPGSHFRQINEMDIARYQNVAGQVLVDCPAGTLLALHHGIWHCGRRSRSDRVRYMFKVRLNPSVRQVRLWDVSDLHDPEVQEQVRRQLAESQPWYEHAAGRLEQAQRAALWRRLSGDPGFQVEYWLGRLENQGRPHLRDLLP